MESPRLAVNVVGLKLHAFDRHVVRRRLCQGGTVAHAEGQQRHGGDKRSPRLQTREAVSWSYFFNDACRCLACSRCATNAGRTLTSSAFSSSFCRSGNQGLVDRIEHRLVIGDFVVDVGLVERRALERLQIGDVLIAARLQALARGVVLRRHLELGRQIDRLTC